METLDVVCALSDLLCERGELPQTETLRLRDLTVARRASRADDDITMRLVANLCAVTVDLGKSAETESRFREVLAHHVGAYGPEQRWRDAHSRRVRRSWHRGFGSVLHAKP